ncbi:MAG TPA: M36 family metallopeptidase [Solimonas sp.]|nr:M36 family metallopeptidase [Solimonas sp.]
MKLKAWSAAALLGMCGATGASAAELANFDSWLEALNDAPAIAAPAALPQGRLPTQFDRRMGLPTFLWARGDEAVPAVGALPLDALIEARARSYLRSQAGALRLGDSAIDQALAREARFNGHGAAIARFQQRVDGLEVFNRSLNVMMDRAGKLVAISGYFASGHGSDMPAFALDAGAAVVSAIAQLGAVPIAPPAIRETRGAYTWFEIPALAASELALTRGPRAKPVYYAHLDRLEPAFYVELFAASATETLAYSYVISAVDGALLSRKNLKASAFTYRVFADLGGINQPYDGPLGNGYEPFPSDDPDAPVTRTGAGSQLVTLGASPLISTGDPWLPEGATESSGNNVDAYTDSALPDGNQPGVPGTAPLGSGADVRAQVTSPGVFDYPLVADMDPTTTEGRKAAAVTLFYVNNWLHDLYYDHGFDELSGVAQASNYGRGGEEGDAVLAEGQDWSGRNNANMATPADGSAATMQMYLFDGPGSLPGAIVIGPSSPGDYDGTLDPLIIAHENFHYVSNRLVGDGSGLNNNQGGSMGEGWGDLASLFIAVREEDRALAFNHDYQGTYSVGVYVDPSFYFSVRRQPYSTDFSKNSFTFRHIADGEPAPSGAPTQGSGAGSAEVHASGEIWANMMWECWAQLLNDPRHDFAEARDRMVGYTIEGLKMTPISPTFTEARDGVLAAALASDPEDFARCGHGFARRGIGLDAVAPDRGSTDHAGVVESYEDFAGPPKDLVVDQTARYGGALSLHLLLALLGAARLRRPASHPQS